MTVEHLDGVTIDLIQIDVIPKSQAQYDVRLAVTVRCGGKPQFVAIMLGAVLRKVAALLDETERKARTDDD